MQVYVIVLEDRHTDVQLEAFADPDKAVARAKEIASSYHDGEDPEWQEMKYDNDWLYACRLTGESDCIRVEAVEVQ